MVDYSELARFYDNLMGDRAPMRARLLSAIDRYLPTASSLLELGCGTGAVLASLPEHLSLTGLDRSPEMLAIARSNVVNADFVEAEISSFGLGRSFDVIACVFDTINHLTRFELWEDLFRLTHEHLNDQGLFVFDVNPIGRLRQLSESPPWVHHFDGNTLIMDVTMLDEHLSCWDIKVFEHLTGNEFLLRQERIEELGVELAEMRSSLGRRFTLLDEADEDGTAPTDDSSRAYFVARRL